MIFLETTQSDALAAIERDTHRSHELNIILFSAHHVFVSHIWLVVLNCWLDLLVHHYPSNHIDLQLKKRTDKCPTSSSSSSFLRLSRINWAHLLQHFDWMNRMCFRRLSIYFRETFPPLCLCSFPRFASFSFSLSLSLSLSCASSLAFDDLIKSRVCVADQRWQRTRKETEKTSRADGCYTTRQDDSKLYLRPSRARAITNSFRWSTICTKEQSEEREREHHARLLVR